MKNLYIFLAIVACACTPTVDSPKQAGEANPSTPPAAESDAERSPRATAPMPEVDDSRAPDYWQWDTSKGLDLGFATPNARSVWYPDSNVVLGHFNKPAGGSDPGPWGLRRIGHGVDGQELWRLDLTQDRIPEGRLAKDADTIYATHHSGIASGARVSAVDSETGKIVWTVALQGLGHVDHGQYRNETRIEVDPRGVVIYGRESEGAYTEILDPHTGAQRRLTQPDPTLVSLTLTGESADKPIGFADEPSTLVNGHQVYSATAETEYRRLKVSVHTLPQGSPVPPWTTEVESDGCEGASLALTGEQPSPTLWVADYCRDTTGVQLHQFEAVTGKHLGSSRGIGLHNDAHSKHLHDNYFNETRLSQLHEYLLISGHEAAGDYLEIVDPETGQSLVNLTFRKP